MRFGANYTPRRRWFHAWLDFDVAETCGDLAQIADLGLDHVRVFPLWPLLQPDRGLIGRRALTDLLTLVDVAADCGLDVMVDGIQGHLSSFDFYPAWTRTAHRRNVFSDPDVVAAQADLLRALGTALADRPNVLGLQLGNESNNLVTHDPVSAGEVEVWLDTLLAAAAAALPDRLVTHSAYDAAWYVDDHPFTPEFSARKGSLTTVHPWVFTGRCAARYGAGSVQVDHLAEYGVELAKAYADDPARPVWVQEVGAPAPHIPAGAAPDFARATVANALDCTDLYGVTWWCSHDVSRELLDFPELEYTLGLIDADGVVKPVGKAVADAVATARATPPAPAPRTTALVLDAGPATRSVSGPGGAFFEAWMARRAEGERPAVVLAARAGDTAHLAGRGITGVAEPS